MPPTGTPLTVPIRAGYKQFAKDLNKSQSRLNKFGGTSKKAIKGIALSFIGIATAAAAVSISAVKDFAKFDTSVREVGTLLGDVTKDQLKGLSDEIRGVAKDFGAAGEDISKAFYDSISAGVADESSVAAFVKQAAKFAVAGAAETGAGVDLLSSAINAFGLDASDATRVSDTFFGAVKAGKTTVQEIASSFSNIGPPAAAAGVSLEGVTAWMAQLTLSGTPTAQATTQIKAALAELSKTGSILDKNFREIAGRGFKDFLDSGGKIEDAFGLLHKQSQDTGKSMFEMAGSVEAVQGLLGVTGKNADSFSDTLGTVADSAGATDIAFGVMAESSEFKLGQLSAAITDIKLGLGERLQPVLMFIIETVIPLLVEWFGKARDVIQSLAEEYMPVLVDWFGKFRDKIVEIADKFVENFVPVFQEHVMPILQTIGDFIKDTILPALADFGLGIIDVVKAIGEFIINNPEVALASLAVVVGGIVVLALTSLATALWAAAAGMFALFSPFILGVSGVALLVGAFVWAYDNVDLFKTIVDEIVDFFKGPFVDGIVAAVDGLTDFIDGFEILEDFRDLVTEVVTNVVVPAFHAFVWVLKEVVLPILKELWEAVKWAFEVIIGPIVKLVLQNIVDRFNAVKKVFRGFIIFLTGVFTGDFGKAWDGIKLIFGGAFDFIKAQFDLLIGIGKVIVNAIRGVLNTGLQAINDFIPNKISIPFAPDIDLPDNPFPMIPHLAKGGIVTKPMLSLVGEAGPEAIIPLDQMGKMGDTYNINISIDGGLSTSAEIGEAVEASLQQWGQKKGGLDLRVVG